MILPVTSPLRRVVRLALVGVLLLGAAVVVASPADAAGGTLTVTTLDRTGRAVHTQYGAVSVTTGDQRYFWTGSAHRLPRGLYDVYAAISTVRDGSETVGVQRVRVSGAARLTIDARRGRPVNGRLQPAPPDGFVRQTSVWLCAAHGRPITGGASFDGGAYVIPSSLREVEFAFSSIWSSADGNQHEATYYAGAAVHRNGAPAGMTRTFRQADLTHLAVKGRTGLQSGDARVDVRSASSDSCRDVTMQLFPTATLPYTLHLHVPAGSWSLGQFAQDSVYGPARRYAAGHSYTAVMGAAAWGPGGNLPLVDQYCRCLTGLNGAMFTGPGLLVGASARVSYTLRQHGRLLARRTIDPDLDTFAPRLPGAGWYVLTAVARRHPVNPLPRGVLSPSTSLRLHFRADPGRTMTVGGFATRFLPHGLGPDNRARTATTTVGLALLRDRVPEAGSDVVSRVRAWMSGDGGHTWHAVRVLHAHGAWSITVHNPGSGFVALRASVVDAHGNAATTTVQRAYAIG